LRVLEGNLGISTPRNKGESIPEMVRGPGHLPFRETPPALDEIGGG